MDVTDVLRRLSRLRLAVGVVIVAALVAALVGYVSAGSSRQSRSAVVIVPPKVANVTGGNNPLLNLDNNLAQLAVVLTGALGTETVARALARDGATAEFTVSTVTGDNPTFSQLSPQLVFTVTGASDAVTERTANALVEQSGTALDALQARAGVPESARASVVEVVGATPPIVVSGGRLRSAGTLGLGVIVLGLLFVLAVDALRRRRSGTAATSSAGQVRTPPSRDSARESSRESAARSASSPAAPVATPVAAAASVAAPVPPTVAAPVAATTARRRPGQTFVTRLLAPPAVMPTPVRNTASEAAPPARRPAKRSAAARETAPLPEVAAKPDIAPPPETNLDDTLLTGWSSVSLSGEPSDTPAEVETDRGTSDAPPADPGADSSGKPDAEPSDTDVPDTSDTDTTETSETDSSDADDTAADTETEGAETDTETPESEGHATKPPAAKTAARKTTRPAGAGSRGGGSSSRRARARKARG